MFDEVQRPDQRIAAAVSPGTARSDTREFVGVVFIFDEGVVAVSLGGPSASDLIISRARSLESLDFVDTTADWGEVILHHLEFSRELIPLLDGGVST